MYDAEGLVIRVLGGLCEVAVADRIVLCGLRGRLRREGSRVLAGDRVVVRLLGDGTGRVEEVRPRGVELVRPPVANVDRALVVGAAVRPPLDRELVDRMLVLVSHRGLAAAVCVNKVDLLPEGGRAEVEAALEGWRRAGYPAVAGSARTGEGIEAVRDFLRGGITVFAGASGVGKSSLLNAAIPGLSLRTGEVSERIGRGRHTTRHPELLPLPGGGRVVDTPGFSHLDLGGIAPAELWHHFPELAPHAGGCRFGADCRHRSEPGCAVRAAAGAGLVAPWRYAHYLMFLQEVEDYERRHP